MLRTLMPLVVCLLGLAQVPNAQARKPEDVFAGQVLLSPTPFPGEARSESSYVAQLKKHSSDRFQENEAKKEWKIFYAAFFKQPLNDMEVTVKFYDVSGGGKRMVQAYEQYLNGRGERALRGKFNLPRSADTYEANTRILLVIENRKRVLASKTFYLEGRKRSFSGKVVFSEEDAQAQDQ